ncbi:uncharacterized protein N7459_007904 [Penicillium hispanicum]|uniref:uncharacterized protein n=1 Tax=Penicillium hispanicum TaxID=1080232 RepID=UPI0025402149|nr:uncharacterized protein N7459_007904 [Penicillium hispanicum]KAJ5573477.1 hypothetical protein N7459_007904 [Penicillium hispanicum]
MASSTPTPKPKPNVPVALSFEAIDDLIYDARAGDLEALTADVANLASQHSCPESQIVASAIDMEDESEGGTGSCVLHFPAANGNIEILNFLLQKLSAADAALRTAFVNHRNHSGNTPLHWAALNTHLECVKALVEAGADVAIKNDAGHDAVFLAERAAWSAAAEEGDANANEQQSQEIEMTVGGEEAQGEGQAEGQPPAGEMSAGRQVVEWLLGSEKAGGLESGANEGESSA